MLQGAVEVGEGVVGAAEGVERERAVVEDVGGTGCQGDAGVEVGAGVLEAAEAVGGDPAVEERPEAVRIEVQRAAERGDRAGPIAGPEPRQADGVEVGRRRRPERLRRAGRGLGHLLQPERLGVKPAGLGQGGPRPEHRLGLVEDRQSLAVGLLANRGVGRELDGEIGIEQGKVAEIVGDLAIDAAGAGHEAERPGGRPGLAEPGPDLAEPRESRRRGVAPVGEAEPVGQVVQVVARLAAAGPRAGLDQRAPQRRIAGPATERIEAVVRVAEGLRVTAPRQLVAGHGQLVPGPCVPDSILPDERQQHRRGQGQQPEPRQGLRAPPPPLRPALAEAPVRRAVQGQVVDVAAEVVAEARGVGVAVGRVGLEAAGDDRAEAGRRHLAGAGDVQGRVDGPAQRVDVGAAVDRGDDRPARGEGLHRRALLGRHRARRPADRAGRGAAGDDRRARQVEVQQHRRAVGREQDVGRLDVHVHEPAAVGGV